MFPEWKRGETEDGQTYCDAEAIPEELRTKAEREETEEGDFHEIEPITTLRRNYLSIYAEIVRIDYWIGIKEDGQSFYQVNLVNPRNNGFDREQIGTISIAHNSHYEEFDEVESVIGLLADAKKYIAWKMEQ